MMGRLFLLLLAACLPRWAAAVEPAAGLLLPGDPASDWLLLQWKQAGRGAMDEPVPDSLRVDLRAGGGEGAWLEAGLAAPLSPALSARFWLSGTSEAGGERLLGTNTTKAGWTGRVLRGTLLWRHEGFEVEWGRRSFSFGEDRLSELAWGRQVPAVDMLRYALRSPGGHWRLDVGCAQLAAESDGGMRRWAASHRLSWRPGPRWSFSLGDQAIFTGPQRGFELQYLSPFLPFFLENFEGYSERDHGEPTDADNSAIVLGWETNRPLGTDWGLEHYGELLVDELQIDADDRAKFDDVFGLTLGLAASRALPAGRRLRLRWEGSWLAHWAYIHPGLETSAVEKGIPLGNAEGGDLEEQHLELQLHRLAGPVELYSLAVGRLKKGAIQVGDAWAAGETKDRGWPLAPVRGSWSWRVAFLRELGRGLTLSGEAERAFGDGDLTTRLRLAWTGSFAPPGGRP